MFTTDEAIKMICVRLRNLEETMRKHEELLLSLPKDAEPPSATFTIPGDDGEDMVVRIERTNNGIIPCTISVDDETESFYATSCKLTGIQCSGDRGIPCGVLAKKINQEVFYFDGKSREFDVPDIDYKNDPLPLIASKLRERIMAVRAWRDEEKRKAENTFEFSIKNYDGDLCVNLTLTRNPMSIEVEGGKKYLRDPNALLRPFHLSRILTGTDSESAQGIFNMGTMETFQYKGHARTFSWNPINYDKDSPASIAQEIQYRANAVRGWILAYEPVIENVIQFTLDTGETVRIEREPFAGRSCIESRKLTGTDYEYGSGIFCPESTIWFRYKKEEKSFQFSPIRYAADPAPRIIAQLKLRIKSVRAWIESLVAEEEARKENL